MNKITLIKDRDEPVLLIPQLSVDPFVLDLNKWPEYEIDMRNQTITLGEDVDLAASYHIENTDYDCIMIRTFYRVTERIEKTATLKLMIHKDKYKYIPSRGGLILPLECVIVPGKKSIWKKMNS